MKFHLLEPQGFCFGVRLAIEKLDGVIKRFPNKKIYLLGLIIHNNYIINDYKNKGVIILDTKIKKKEEYLLDIFDSVVVFQAHGSSDKAFEIAKNNCNIIIDATCPFVLKIHKRLKEHLLKGYNVYYIGKLGHDETEAALTIPGVKLYDGNISDNSYITNQTTLSYYDLEDEYKKIKTKANHIIIDNLICTATKDRQKAVLDDTISDFYIVVGDKASSNSNKLYELCLKKKPSVFIESVKELDLNVLKRYNMIGITSGASTPDYLVNEVVDFLANN